MHFARRIKKNKYCKKARHTWATCTRKQLPNWSCKLKDHSNLVWEHIAQQFFFLPFKIYLGEKRNMLNAINVKLRFIKKKTQLYTNTFWSFLPWILTVHIKGRIETQKPYCGSSLFCIANAWSKLKSSCLVQPQAKSKLKLHRGDNFFVKLSEKKGNSYS